jgi:chorismate synthase
LGSDEVKFTVVGDSHGSGVFGLIEELPSGVSLSIERINQQLLRRQKGYGRGKRMELEQDKALVRSGLWRGVTTGAPLLIEIPNKVSSAEKSVRSIPRPGHSDYAAWTRYKLNDLAVYAERSSARWTAAATAVGSVASQILHELGIALCSSVIAIGNVSCGLPSETGWISNRDASPVFCHDKEASQKMVEEIEDSIKAGDTLGGRFVVIADGVPTGTGGYGTLFERLDSRIGEYFMAIPSVKGVFIGNPDVRLRGSAYHDKLFVENGMIVRKSNNAGGIEGGISNGEQIVVEASVKPIPSLRKGISSVDLSKMNETAAPYVRADTTAVPAASVVGESMLALLLLEAILERFGSGDFCSIKRRVKDESLPYWNDGLGEKHYR